MPDSVFPPVPAHFQQRKENTYLPLELSGEGQNKFWLVITVTAWYENGVARERRELCVCCTDCNWGFDSTPPAVGVKDLLRIGQETATHAKECSLAGRTIPLPRGERDA